MVELDIMEFLKGDDLTDDTVVTFINEGEKGEIKKPEGEDNVPTFEIGVQLPDGTKKTWTLNKTSQRTLAAVYGKDTSLWNGKTATLFVIDQNVRGTMKKVIYSRTPVAQ